MALKVACDVLYNQDQVDDKIKQYGAVTKVIQHPE